MAGPFAAVGKGPASLRDDLYRNICRVDSADEDFATQHPEWAQIIQTEALHSLKRAFNDYPIIVRPATKNSKATWDQCKLDPKCVSNNLADQAHIVRVAGDLNPAGIGYTYSASLTPYPGVRVTKSNVYYYPLMKNSLAVLQSLQPAHQQASWCPNYTRLNADDVRTFRELARMLGKAIGNAAVHEIGHQLSGFPFIDCGPEGAQGRSGGVCENKDNFVYNFYTANVNPNDPNLPDDPANGGRFFYEPRDNPLIHWGPKNRCYLDYYSTHWHWYQVPLYDNPCKQ